MKNTILRMVEVTILFISLTFVAVGADASKVISFTFGMEGDKLDKSSNHSRYGVSKETIKRYNKYYGTSYTVSTLTKSQAYTIAKTLYYDKYNIGKIHDNKLAIAIFDFMYNSNPTTAAKKIEKAAVSVGVKNIKIDGKLTISELNEINKCNTDNLANKICDSRLSYMKSLKVWKKYKNGWTKRVISIKKM